MLRAALHPRHILLAALRRLERVTRQMREGLERGGRRAKAGSELARTANVEEWEAVCTAPIRPVHSLSSPVARAVAELTHPGQTLLEAGCGLATVSAELATAGRRIMLADFSDQILQRGEQLFAASGLPRPELTVCDLRQQLPWPDRSIDVVWSSGVLEHWTDDELRPIVREMARISRHCVISLVPSASCLLYRLGKYLAEQAGCWPYGRELPRTSLREIFEQAGLQAVQERVVWSEAAPELLSLVDEQRYDPVRRWWHSLAADDPLRAEQGYLLLTAGYRAQS